LRHVYTFDGCHYYGQKPAYRLISNVVEIEDMSQSTLLDVAREMIAQNRKKLGSAEF